MGSIRDSTIKSICKQIFELHKDRVSINFDDNKKLVEEVVSNANKKMRNRIAGYLVTLKEKSSRKIIYPKYKKLRRGRGRQAQKRYSEII